MIGLLVGNVGLWQAKTLEWRRVTQDLRNGGPLEVLIVAKLIKWLPQFSNLTSNLHYMYLNFAPKIYNTIQYSLFNELDVIIQ